MCIILDVNSIGKFKNPDDEDMEPVRNWLERKNGKIVYSYIEQFNEEWDEGGGYQRRGKFKERLAQEVQEKVDELEQSDILRSDDPHIIALAIIAEVKVLVSNDRRLHEDFKNRNLVGGKVYQTKSHSRLLRNDTCP